MEVLHHMTWNLQQLVFNRIWSNIKYPMTYYMKINTQSIYKVSNMSIHFFFEYFLYLIWESIAKVAKLSRCQIPTKIVSFLSLFLSKCSSKDFIFIFGKGYILVLVQNGIILLVQKINKVPFDSIFLRHFPFLKEVMF